MSKTVLKKALQYTGLDNQETVYRTTEGKKQPIPCPFQKYSQQPSPKHSKAT